MKSAMRSISFSPIPKRVTSIVPRRTHWVGPSRAGYHWAGGFCWSQYWHALANAHVQAPAERPDIGEHLVRTCITLVGAEHRDTALL